MGLRACRISGKGRRLVGEGSEGTGGRRNVSACVRTEGERRKRKLSIHLTLAKFNQLLSFYSLYLNSSSNEKFLSSNFV